MRQRVDRQALSLTLRIPLRDSGEDPMTVAFENQTLAEIVTEDLTRSRVLERLGVDYCCGGKRTLEQACAQSSLELETVCTQLADNDTAAREDGKTDYGKLSLEELVENIIEYHHLFLRNELPNLSRLAEKVFRSHGANHTELGTLRFVLQDLASELMAHMDKEEQILFPICISLSRAEAKGEITSQSHCGSISNPIRVMEEEHDNVGKLLKKIRRITRDYAVPEDACVSYKALLARLEQLENDLHIHIHKENNILFPKAIKTEASL